MKMNEGYSIEEAFKALSKKKNETEGRYAIRRKDGKFVSEEGVVGHGKRATFDSRDAAVAFLADTEDTATWTHNFEIVDLKEDVDEAVVEKKVCPKCGKEVCECDKAPVEECDKTSVEECNKNIVTESADEDNSEDDEYFENAKKFVKEIEDNMDAATAHDYFYNQYEFDKHGPEDEAEQIVYDALRAKIGVDECLTEDADEDVDTATEDTVDVEVADKEAGCYDAAFVRDVLNDTIATIKDTFELDEEGSAQLDEIVAAKLAELFPAEEEVEETNVEVDEVSGEEATEEISAEE